MFLLHSQLLNPLMDSKTPLHDYRFFGTMLPKQQASYHLLLYWAMRKQYEPGEKGQIY